MNARKDFDNKMIDAAKSHFNLTSDDDFAFELKSRNGETSCQCVGSISSIGAGLVLMMDKYPILMEVFQASIDCARKAKENGGVEKFFNQSKS